MTGGMMFKGTPGPWEVNDAAETVESKYEHGIVNDGWIICGSFGPDGPKNIRLIAAAPELLAVLIDVQDFLTRSGYDTKMVKSAIAKALGEQK